MGSSRSGHGTERDRLAIGDHRATTGNALRDGIQHREIRRLVSQVGVDDHAEHRTNPEDETCRLVLRPGVGCGAGKERYRGLVADGRGIDRRLIANEGDEGGPSVRARGVLDDKR